MELWQLFVDESGPLEDRREENVVTGLLVQESDNDGFREILKKQLCDVYRLVPYPPHASSLNLGVFYVAAHSLALSQGPSPPPKEEPWVRQAFDQARCDILASSAPETLPFQDALRDKVCPGYDALAACNLWLERNHPGSFQALQAVQERDRRAVWNLLAELGKRYGPQRCFVVAASNLLDEEALDPATEPDLYLQLFQTLLERVVGILRARDGIVRVIRVYAACRDVQYPPMKRPRAMDTPAVANVTAKAMKFPLYGPSRIVGEPLLRFVAMPPEDANRRPDTHPGLVLVDHISNRLYRALKGNPDWKRLKSRSAHRFALPVETFARAFQEWDALPTVAADGLAREAVHRSFSGDSLPDLARIVPRWGREEAEAWARAASAFLTRQGGTL